MIYFVPFEGEELDNSVYAFENLPPIESVYVDQSLAFSSLSQISTLTGEQIFSVESDNSVKCDKQQIVSLSKARLVDLTVYQNVPIQEITCLAPSWKGWSALAKMIQKNKPHNVIKLSRKTELDRQQKMSLEDRLNFIPFQPKQVAYL